jgi:large subunit ribosomal protein L9
MRLLLRESVSKLGRIGDIVEVPDGYGRNYLLPQGLAVAVTPENIRKLDADKRKLIALEEKKQENLRLLAERLNETSLTIPMAASEEGHLYGSVNAQVVTEHLSGEGIEIEAKMVILEKPIKELGVYNVPIHLYPEIDAELKVWVVEGGEESGEA